MTGLIDFWNLRVFCTEEHVSLIEEAFSEGPVALSVLEDGSERIVEALYQQEPDSAALHAKLGILAALGGVPSFKCEIVPIGNLDWIKKVCEHFEPLPIARWTVYGAAFRDQIPNTTLGLQIDATSAFGTGEHPTTRGCLLMLDRLLRRYPRSAQWKMLDMGCGSGILAMAFAKATGGQALGIDMDGPSIDIARSNLTNNNLEAYVRVETGMGYSHSCVGQNAPYDLIMANVFARPLCEMAKDLNDHLKPGGFAILSGLLNPQAKAVVSAHRQHGLVLRHRMRLGTWSVLALHRPVRAS